MDSPETRRQYSREFLLITEKLVTKNHECEKTGSCPALVNSLPAEIRRTHPLILPVPSRSNLLPLPSPCHAMNNEIVANNNENGQNLTNTQMDAIRRLLECPVCLKISGKSIYFCNVGHSICSECRDQVLRCPLCQSPILNSRNLLAEQIIGTLKNKCQYAGEGCTAMILETEKEIHKSECHFRPIKCCYTGGNRVCKDVIMKYRTYVKHLLNVHKINGVKGTIMNVNQKIIPDALELIIDISWNSWPIQYMEAFKQIFITGSSIRKGKMFWWLYIYADHITADSYQCTIALKNKDKGLEMVWSGPVHQIRTEPEIVESTGLCLMVCKENFLPFTYPTIEIEQEKAVTKTAWDLVFIVEKSDYTPISHIFNGVLNTLNTSVMLTEKPIEKN